MSKFIVKKIQSEYQFLKTGCMVYRNFMIGIVAIWREYVRMIQRAYKEENRTRRKLDVQSRIS